MTELEKATPENRPLVRSYKALLQKRVRLLRKNHPHLTWQYIGQQLPMQYTYLSKVLNDESLHLSADHLYKVTTLLDFSPEESDFILLLREYEASTSETRRTYLFKKISSESTELNLGYEKADFKSQNLLSELEFLFDPLALIVQIALTIPKYQQNPRLLVQPLGLTLKQLQRYLEILAKNNFIQLGEEPYSVKKIMQSHLHYGRNHPLMRIHQSLIKSQLVTRLNNTEEENKTSFLVTFTMDDAAFQKAQAAFHKFLQELETIAKTSRDENVFQMNFDLFKWF